MASDRSHLLSTLGLPRWQKEGTGASALARGLLQVVTSVAGVGGSFPNLTIPPAVPQRMNRAIYFETPCGQIPVQEGFSPPVVMAKRAFEERWGAYPWFRGASFDRLPTGEEVVSVCVARAGWMEVIHTRAITQPVLDVRVVFRPAEV